MSNMKRTDISPPDVDQSAKASSQADKRAAGDRGTGKAKYELSVKIKGDSAASGNPVLLTLTLRNNSEESVFVVDTGTVSDYKFEIKNAGGEVVQPSDRGRKKLASTGFKRIVREVKPGQEISSEIDLGELFDLSAGAGYTLILKRNILMSDKEHSSEIESNPIKIELSQ